MKIRNGFISNSSSTSFLLVGKKVEIKDIKKLDKHYIVIGPSIFDGLDVFDLYDYETLYVISKYPDKFEVFLVENFELNPDISNILEENEYYNIEQISDIYYTKFKKKCIYNFKDHNSSKNYYDIIEMHDLNISINEIKNAVKKYFRKEKLKKILNK